MNETIETPEDRIKKLKDTIRTAQEEVDLLEGLDPVKVVPSGNWRAEPSPAPALWRDYADFLDSVVGVGEVAVLAGAGKAGKSYLTLSLAIAADAASRAGQNYGPTCGLRVRAGRVVVVSFEDSPKRIDERADAMVGAPDAVHVVDPVRPMYGVDPISRRWGPLETWRPTWAAIAAAAPVLVVVDTGPKAMGGETNDPGAVIGFLQAIEAEARAGGFGALVTAHDTKAARDAARRGSELDAGAIAGSGQWHDSPRGVIHLTKTGPGDAERLLECVKANYGRDGWGARLSVRYNGGKYAGLQLLESLDADAMEAAREALHAEKHGEPGDPCKGMNRSGAPCGNTAKAGETLCYVHKGQAAARNGAAAPENSEGEYAGNIE